MKKNHLPNLFCFFICLLISCNTQSNQKLIVGNWIPLIPEAKGDERIIFLENNIAISTRLNKIPEPDDSAQYKISDDGKTITTTEKNGRIEELEIIKLSKTDLVLCRKGEKDTLRLKRE